MATPHFLRGLVGIWVMTAWVLGSAMHAKAETLTYGFCPWVSKAERVRIGDPRPSRRGGDDAIPARYPPIG